MKNFENDIIALLKKHKLIGDGYLLTNVNITLEEGRPASVDVDGFII